MGEPVKFNLDRWLDDRFSYPGISKTMLTSKKNIWTATFFCMCSVIGITLFLAVFYPGTHTLIAFGLAIIICQLTYVVAAFLHKGLMKWLVIIVNNLYLIITFITILKLGGITHSCGLVFIGLASIFLTMPLQNTWVTLELTFVYISTIVCAALLHPFLSVSPEVSPEMNTYLFAVNFIWMTATTTYYTLQFISNSIKLQDYEIQKAKELNEVKTKFFTNITHEFRTPLTIILGMVDLIREDPQRWLDEGLNKIRNGGNNLLHLVNQMLNLSKLEAGMMPAHAQQGDIITYLRYLIESFSSLAAGRKVQLLFVPAAEQVIMDFDEDQLLQIVSNLLTNAIKYTPPNGKVILSVDVEKKENRNLIIRVSDDGPGIPVHQLENIFERFYRIETSTDEGIGGTGLGLALVRETVKNLDGTLEVDSPAGSGAIFSVRLPITNQAPLVISAAIKHSAETLSTIRAILDKPDEEIIQETGFGILPSLLIVEDNRDVVEYLKALLEKDYHILIASNGKSGIQTALSEIPDIIISDVMMPVMDGISLLDTLKNDFRTSHIPIVMLTAKADIDSKLLGLERGADAYLSKPFNTSELFILLKNLIALRIKLQHRYSSMDILTPADDINIRREDEFMQKIRLLLEANLDDEQFGITELCSEIGMSRAQLYRKFNILTDKTVNEYILSFRLYKSKELLLSSDLNVSEVAYEVGFKNLSHFSRVFTREFGINPSDIRK